MATHITDILLQKGIIQGPLYGTQQKKNYAGDYYQPISSKSDKYRGNHHLRLHYKAVGILKATSKRQGTAQDSNA